MKTEQELNSDILEITLTIQNKYPELTKYIEEMPVTVPNKEEPEINRKHLENYYNSLVSLVNGYNNNNNEPSL
ncbi:MAG: hypothetical protein IPI10_04890 [Bacteroidetes bacterium]|nr:hypothetical protein [Bacteroidota bacterium]MBP9847199.1 hypothetical protein [Saprospiraceae bacterium]